MVRNQNLEASRVVGIVIAGLWWIGASGLPRPVAAAENENLIEARDAQLTSLPVVEVAASQAGLISELKLHEGQSIGSNELVALVDDQRARLDVVRFKQELAISVFQADDDVDIRHAQKSLAVAKVELARAEAANAKISGSVPERDVTHLRLSAERAELAVEQAQRKQTCLEKDVRLKETQLQVAELTLSQHRVVTQIGGTVVQVVKQQGEWVQPGDGIVRIAPTNPTRAEGFISADNAMEDLRGSKAEFAFSMAGQKPIRIRGVVTFVSPDVNPVNRLVKVRAEFPSSGINLRPGVAGRLRIQLAPVNSPSQKTVAER